jgi:hypothetical protein
MSDIEEFIGRTLARVEGKPGDDVLRLWFSDGTAFEMYHSQDCCESVWLDDVIGDWSDIIGFQILEASKREQSKREQSKREREQSEGEFPKGDNCHHADSYTWTFYELRTIRGFVQLRWYGSSNGYYSESVDIRQISRPLELVKSHD